jgi:hypothetical protein
MRMNEQDSNYQPQDKNTSQETVQSFSLAEMASRTKDEQKYKRRFAVVTIFLVLAIAAIVFTGSRLLSRVSGGMKPQSIREISQLATLEFTYTDIISIIEEEQFKLFGIWDIDPGEHILIVKYRGVIKLGINCDKILFNEYQAESNGKKRVEIKLPDAVLISSETPMDSFEVIVNKGVFTKNTVDLGVFFKEAGKRQAQYDSDAISGELAKTARENAKKQLQGILESFSEIKDNYDLVWVN